MGINDNHEDYDAYKNHWEQVDDLCGARNLKQYLVKLNPDDKSAQNVTRNNQYFARAVYYNIPGRTVRGMVGTLFRNQPNLTVPPGMEYVEKNIDGYGKSIYQQAQTVARGVVKLGRAGLWVDYPQTDGQATRHDMDSGLVFATVRVFSATAIINWKEMNIGAKVVLSRVVLSDTIDGEDARIELSLDDALVYTVRIYVYKETEWQLKSEYRPTKGDGSYWDRIPFTFVGSEDNAPDIDDAPMADIVALAVGHWNNSASYEDSIWFVGQVQPWMSGLSQEHLDLLNKNNMYVGSGFLLAVPEGGSFGLAQAAPNLAVRQAMSDKVDMMIGLGAIFLQPGSAVKTATQSEGEQDVQHSVLSLISVNISSAYDQALGWAADFMNLPEDEIRMELNKEFVKPRATAQDLQAIVAAWLQGAIPFSDQVRWQQQHGFIDPAKTAEEVAEEIAGGAEMPDLGGGE